MKYKNPDECNKDIKYHTEERESAAESAKVINSLANIRPHDIQNIAPQGYNLSIQYDQDKKGGENSKATQEKNKQKQ